jgi:drug/metabolite transporter (DMT)-like permease
MKEKVSAWQWLLLAGGMAGTLVIIRPGSHAGLGWSALVPLACVAASTAFQLVSSHLGRQENPAATHMWTMGICALLGALALPWTWAPVDTPWLWFMLVFMGVVGAAGHFVLMTAYGRAPASTLMPFMYGQIGFAVLGGWLVFAHAPDASAWAGMVLIAGCGIVSAWLTARDHRPLALLPET